MMRSVQFLCVFTLLSIIVMSVTARDTHPTDLLSYQSEDFHVTSYRGKVVKREVEQADCTSDGNICTELVGGGKVGQFTNNAYIEMSVQVKFPKHKNIIIFDADNKKVTNWVIRTVIPARKPGGAPVVMDVFTAKEAKPGSFSWTWNFQSRFGSYKAKHATTAKYRLPFAGKFKVGQGYNGKATHFGQSAFSIDFTMPQGTRVLAARAGVVASVEQSNYRSKYEPGVCPKPVKRSCDAPGSDDNHVFIRYPDKTFGMYAHFKQNGVAVSVGDEVTEGQLIGYSGNTGLSSGPHLHISVNKATPFTFKHNWNSETIKVSYVDVKGKSVTPKAGSTYEGAPEPKIP
jgi:murein DD-endopeptidase MepM/ murein hydrolase activator NlpD